MKKTLMIMLFCTMFTAGQAQTFAEWFKQKQTQKKYLVQQIAILKVYKNSLQKGYAIAKEGLTTIGNSKNNEYTLHGNYFTSLQKVHPSIKNYNRISDIIFIQNKIIQACNIALIQARESGVYNENEISYVQRVYGRLLNECKTKSEELITITVDNKLEMTDNERMERIDALYDDMQDQYTFLKSFSNATIVLAASRTKAKNNVETSRILYGIKNEEL